MNHLYRCKLIPIIALVLLLTQTQAHLAFAGNGPGGLVTGELTYHGGGVMPNPTNYLIFWLPAGQSFEPAGNAFTSAQFEGLAQQYFQDVCGTEYYNTLTPLSFDPANPTNPVVQGGEIQNSCTYGGSWVDTTAYPHAGTQADPLNDGDIRNAISRARTANPGWVSGTNEEYFVYTGYQIQECSASGTCTFQQAPNGPTFCAYHSSWNNLVYAFISDSISKCFVTRASPNDPAADSAVDTSSHEQFEAVSDPNGDAWYNGDGAHENGDQCNFYFGSADTNSDGTNFIFNNHKYRVQWEWLNNLGSATNGDWGFTGCAPSYTHTDGGIEHPDDASFSQTTNVSPASIPGNPGDAVTVTYNYANTSGTDGIYNSSVLVHLGPYMQYSSTAVGSDPVQATDQFGNPMLTYNTGTLGVGAAGKVVINLTLKTSRPNGQTVLVEGGLSGGDQEGCAFCILGQGTGEVKINIVNQPPSWLFIPNQTVDYNDPLSFNVVAVDSDFGDALTLKASGLPSGLSFTDYGNRSGTVSGTDNAPPGTYPVAFTVNDGHNPDVTSTVNFVVNQEESALAYNGATTQDYNDPVTLSATLTEDGDSTKPLSGRTVVFHLGAQSCTGTTDAGGSASCSITPNEAAGSYALTADYAGETNYKDSHYTGTFTVKAEETTTTFTGDTVIAVGSNVAHLSGVLKEDGTAPINGRTLTMTIGTAPNSQSCTGTTDATGTANCTISPVNVPLGPQTVSAGFAGDGYYLPSASSKSAIVFSFLKSGSFSLGDQTAASAAPSTDVTWWSDSWISLNNLSGGQAPSPFKGFLATPSSNPPVCGGTWTTTSGNSPAPPATAPSYMGVAVTDKVTKSGNTLSGKITKIVVVRTDPGYAPNPQSAGTGTIVAIYC